MYKPLGSININELPMPQVRLGLQGAPHTGKTWAALTFPNPIVLNFDNKLGAHKSRTDITIIPFNDPQFIREVMKISNEPWNGGAGKDDPKLPPNRKDALLKWLRTEGYKLETDSTLILDSWTSLQQAIDQQIWMEPSYSKKTNEIDERDYWSRKLDYNKDLCELLRGLNCHVVVTFHEIKRRDEKTGDLLEKITPLMQGQFAAQLAAHFTDWYRQHAIPRVDVKGIPIVLNKSTVDKHELNNYTLKEDTEYFWQVKQDDTVDCGTCMTKLSQSIRFVPATFNSFTKYL